MRSYTNRLAAITPLFGILVLVGCRDSVTSTGTGRRVVARASSVQQTPSQASRAKERVHERNKEDWVGVAHNKMLDAFRRELRKPGVLTNDVCNYVLDFGVRTEQAEAQRRVSEGTKWHAARAARDESRLCANSRGQTAASAVALRLPSEPLAPPARQSSEAQVLLADIETAVEQSANSMELATQLNAVLDRAVALDASDQVIVASTVSVAQNSFEYWETQYDMFEREVIDEYSPCVAEQSSSGVSAETLRDNCLGGQGGSGAVALRSPGQSGPRLAGSRSSMMCGPGLREGFRRVVSGDVSGGFKGAVSGFFSGGLEGAVVGAIAGATVGSAWAALENAWETLRCMYNF